MGAGKPIAVVALALTVLYALASIGFAREIGRTNPALAGYLRLPLFNFSAKYRTGAAMGFQIGSSRFEVFQKIQSRQFVIEPACWGDYRAGGASLYTSDALLAKARTQSRVCLRAPKASVTLRIERGYLESIEIAYVRNELI